MVQSRDDLRESNAGGVVVDLRFSRTQPNRFAHAMFTEHDADWSCLHQPAALGGYRSWLEVN